MDTITVTVVGFIATTITTIYTGIGMPSQIRQNYHNKSMTGQSLLMWICFSCSCLVWVVYGALITNWFIVIPNSIGFTCTAIILLQFIWYRPNTVPRCAFIFDLDGTLVDTQLPFHAIAESEVLKKYGIQVSPQDISDQYAGIATEQVFRELAPDHSPRALVNEKWTIIYQLLETNPLLPISGIASACSNLAQYGIPIGIATASPRKWIKTCLGKTLTDHQHNSTVTLKHFFKDNFVSAEECSEGKPHPEVFLKTQNILTTASNIPNDCTWYVVGDGRADVLGGLAANMQVLYLSGNTEFDDNPAVTRFTTGEALSKHLTELIRS